MNKVFKKWLDEKRMNISKAIGDLSMHKENFPKMNTYPFVCSSLSRGNDLEKLKSRTFEYDDLYYALQLFQGVVTEVNLVTVFIPSRENFSLFIGCTTSMYDTMLTSGSENVREIMKMIEDYIIDNQISSGQLGTVKTDLTRYRTSIDGGHGHNLTTRKERLQGDNITQNKTPQEILEELHQMGVSIEGR